MAPGVFPVAMHRWGTPGCPLPCNEGCSELLLSSWLLHGEKSLLQANRRVARLMGIQRRCSQSVTHCSRAPDKEAAGRRCGGALTSCRAARRWQKYTSLICSEAPASARLHNQAADADDAALWETNQPGPVERQHGHFLRHAAIKRSVAAFPRRINTASVGRPGRLMLYSGSQLHVHVLVHACACACTCA